MREPQMHMCPLCAAPCEAEYSYDDLVLVWSCDHEYIAEPYPIGFRQWADPETREVFRAVACEGLFAQQEIACEERRHELDQVDWPKRALGSAGLAPATTSPPRRELMWTPADRRFRIRWRRISSTTKFSETLKSVYIPRVQEYLNQGSPFLAAIENDTGEATIALHNDLHRQMFRGTVEGEDIG